MFETYQGHCNYIMDGIESDSIDLIFADLPYGTTQSKLDILIPLAPMWEQIKRISKPNTAILLFSQTPFDKVLGCSNLEMLKYEIIVEKKNAAGFFNAKKMPMKAHENILVFYNKLPVYNYIKTTGHKRKTAGKKAVMSSHYGKVVKKTNYDSTERYPRDVVKYSWDKQKIRGLNPFRKPIKLIKDYIKTYSNKGMRVLDFCMGSGTCGEACVELGRDFIGIEKDIKEFKTAVSRINKANYQTSF